MIILRHVLRATGSRASRSFLIHSRYLSAQTGDFSNGSKSSSDDVKGLRKDVIDLYKNLIYLSREWPTDLKPQIRKAFLKNKDVQDANEIRKLIGRGEYVCREIIATYHLKKYRAMKRRYYNDDDREKYFEEIFKQFSQ